MAKSSNPPQEETKSPDSDTKTDDLLEMIKGKEAVIKDLLKEKKYLDTITPLQQELVKLQQWVRDNGEKILIIFEGRDAAGKGGTIKRVVEFLNPRFCRIVALDKPTDRERSQWFFQRYITHLPAGGEICLYDRSWYNRAGVERVMNFCTPEQADEFFRAVPHFEKMLTNSGIHLIKFWFSVSKQSQGKRFTSRESDPLKVWKLSPVDKQAQDLWDAYTKVRNDMLKRTSTEDHPWTCIRSDNKKLSRINAIRFLLNQFPYEGKRKELLKYDKGIIMSPEEEMTRD